MRRNNWKKYIIILIAFIVGLVANLAARAILPRLLPAGMQAWTGLLATLLEIDEADHKAGLQYATKVFYRNMGICQRKPVSVGRGDRTLCSKFIFYDSLFESCE